MSSDGIFVKEWDLLGLSRRKFWAILMNKWDL
jgi:hypothetical protein